MSTFGTCTIAGYLARKPVIKNVGGHDTVELALALNRLVKANGHPDREVTTWFQATIWRERAATAAQYLDKGSPVLVTGTPELVTYQGRDGQQRAYIELRDARWSFAPSAARKPASGPGNGPAAPAVAPAPAASVPDDEPPF